MTLWSKHAHAKAGTDRPLRQATEDDPRIPTESGDAAAGGTPVFEPGEADDIVELLGKATAHFESPR
ncbi:hypothetical protein [Haloactinomyces albus]|uniref:Uncharacterized protein n=1 Tax=Haloactinomyces albus TaxID=1352928 RepID=A0AAE3ZBC0_9ACTN|nr:hypothetical protein [Haloactinomyces albus]MDR7301788.1 hypothetical protein [Haloactinomyces albus]